jgi:FkbM family methyltransferase
MINQRRSKHLFALKHIVKLSIQKMGINVLNRRESEAFLQSGVKEICARWNQEEVPPGLKRYVYSNFQSSRAQLQQDLVAQYLSENLAWGHRFFVEFGATDGVTLSNSHFLEAHGWRGVLVEPDVNWHSELEKNRKNQIDKRCVYSESGLEIEFINSDIGELSGVKIHASHDGWGLTRANGTTSTVETVSLQDLLVEYEAPRRINYLSIDTEGSEFEIIKDFDFHKWDVVFVSIEHNFGDNQAKIDKKMEENEYVRVLETISAWDAWYIKNEYLTGFFR